jgi:hypothetical protein
MPVRANVTAGLNGIKQTLDLIVVGNMNISVLTLPRTPFRFTN